MCPLATLLHRVVAFILLSCMLMSSLFGQDVQPRDKQSILLLLKDKRVQKGIGMTAAQLKEQALRENLYPGVVEQDRRQWEQMFGPASKSNIKTNLDAFEWTALSEESCDYTASLSSRLQRQSVFRLRETAAV